MEGRTVRIFVKNPNRENSPIKKDSLRSLLNGGQGWIRTTVVVRRQIYSLLPLATRAPTLIKFAFDGIWTRGLSLTKGVRYLCATKALV